MSIDDDDFDFELAEEQELQEFQAERSAFERISKGSKLAEISEVIEGKTKTREQRFYENVDKTCRRMMEVNMPEISENDISNILQIASTKLTGTMFKNAIGYVYGFIASRGGRELEPEYVQKIIFGNKNEDVEIKKLREVLFKEAGLKPPDIVKYARLWRNL
jgi:hypothetical protein